MMGGEELSLACRALGDFTRLRMLRLLAANRTEICVCEFVDALEERQYNVSRQLGILEAAGLIRAEREGRWTYHGLAAKKDPAAAALYRLVAKLPEDAIFARDRRRFEERMRLRIRGRCRVGARAGSRANA